MVFSLVTCILIIVLFKTNSYEDDAMSDNAENNNKNHNEKLPVPENCDFFKNGLEERLSTVRIKKVVLDNFKSVEHGEIVFNCGKQFIPYGTSSDILGIYDQNGSGKTYLI